MNRHLNILISGVALALGLCTTVLADPQRNRPAHQERDERQPPATLHRPPPPTFEPRQMPDRPPPAEMQARRMVSMDQVMGHIQGMTPGRQLDAGMETLDGRSVYRVIWLTDQGRRVDYIVDPYTGQVLSRH